MESKNKPPEIEKLSSKTCTISFCLLVLLYYSAFMSHHKEDWMVNLHSSKPPPPIPSPPNPTILPLLPPPLQPPLPATSMFTNLETVLLVVVVRVCESLRERKGISLSRTYTHTHIYTHTTHRLLRSKRAFR